MFQYAFFNREFGIHSLCADEALIANPCNAPANGHAARQEVAFYK